MVFKSTDLVRVKAQTITAVEVRFGVAIRDSSSTIAGDSTTSPAVSTQIVDLGSFLARQYVVRVGVVLVANLPFETR